MTDVAIGLIVGGAVGLLALAARWYMKKRARCGNCLKPLAPGETDLCTHCEMFLCS